MDGGGRSAGYMGIVIKIIQISLKDGGASTRRALRSQARAALRRAPAAYAAIAATLALGTVAF
jgi:hypothetical protein